MTEIEQRAAKIYDGALIREAMATGSASHGFARRSAIAAMLTFAREREAEAIKKAAKVASVKASEIAILYDQYSLAEQLAEIPIAIRELNTPSEIGGEG